MITHLITRRIGIDMGHRVPDHGSKCRNLHGHRYEVEATCSGPLADAGEQNGMVIDFGFLKQIMVEQIDGPFDHAMCLYRGDPVAATLQALDGNLGFKHKLILVPFVPTAENLARYWFEKLEPHVSDITGGRAKLVELKVWETPNGAATYKGKTNDD